MATATFAPALPALALICLFVVGVCRVACGSTSFQEIKQSCPETCEGHGNCNHEFGRCECRFGFGGDDCSQPILPACLSALRPDAVPQYGASFPKNCFCYRQLQDLVCSGDYWRDPVLCEHPVFWMWEELRCYEYPDLPLEKQLSDPPPSEPGGHRVVWKKGVRQREAPDASSFQLEADPDPQQPPITAGGFQLLPLSRCRDRCNERGSCVLKGNAPGCECAPFYTGDSCGEVEAAHCPLACSGRGTCHGGFCHCQKGFWGAGCARSKAYNASGWTPHPTELRIYVYDLPESVSHMRPDDDHWPIHFSIYLAETVLYQRLLGDTAIRTENPWEANLFYVPTHTFYFTGNLGFPGHRFSRVFGHVRDTYPWWNLTAGRNHVAAASNDRGCCDVYRLAAEVQHPIKIVHFAQAPHQGMPLWRGEKAVAWTEQTEDLAKRLQSSMEDPAMLGAMAEYQHLAGRPRFRGFPTFELPALQQEREQCYRPDHDVAFPPYLDPLEGEWWGVLEQAYTRHPNGTASFRRDRPRPVLFHFDGYSKPDMAYSAGVRQGLLALFGGLNRPDVEINKGGGTARMLRSTFCFTPMGFGWGIRLTKAVYAGCVPVMTHDHVWPTLWDVLPYEQFSVRVSRHNLHRLFDFLEAITPQQLARLQDGLAEVHRAFIWHTEVGGLAYNYTMLSLHRKLLNMWTAVF